MTNGTDTGAQELAMLADIVNRAAALPLRWALLAVLLISLTLVVLAALIPLTVVMVITARKASQILDRRGVTVPAGVVAAAAGGGR
ncbi:hypothetical protein [Actinomadura sp. 3N407]|uniref:hypothetical protein n=1 Tax=Actinomadura sp. 3N407 TaxID=3457423 RepID=UPI003FCD653E